MTVDFPAVAHTEPTRTDGAGQFLYVLAVLALACAPTQLALDIHTLPLLKATPLRGIPLPPSLLLLLLAGAVWAVRWLWVRDTRSLPSAAHWLIIATAVLGVFAGDTLQPGVAKEAAQTFIYLVLAVTVFRAAFTTPARIRTAVVALLATTLLAVALGVAQWAALQRAYQPDPHLRTVHAHFSPRAYLTAQTPVQVCSTFATWSEHGYHPSRAAYTGFLALVLPFALALLVSVRRQWGMVMGVGLLCAGIAVSALAGYMLLAGMAGLLVTGVALGARCGRLVLLAVMLFLAALAVVPWLHHNRTEIMREPFQLRLNAVEAGFRYDDGTRHLKKFWGEQQAALNIIRNYPLLGVGAGKYQEHIGRAYDNLGDVDNQRSEPDTQNGYLLTAASTGMLGLAALLLLFGQYFGLARMATRQPGATPWTAAAFGAITVLVLMTLFTNPWLRGTSVFIAALLAIIGNGATLTPPARIPEQEETTCA